MTKNDSVKNRGLAPTIQPEPDFSWICGFRQMLDNVELIMYMKFQKLLIAGCRDMDKKQQNIPKIEFFPICDAQDFFSKIRLCHFCTLMVPKLHAKKQKKNNERSLRYLKSDHGRVRAITRDSLGKLIIQNTSTVLLLDTHLS